MREARNFEIEPQGGDDSESDFLRGINQRLVNASDKVRERVEDRFIEKIKSLGESCLIGLENDFYNLAKDSNNEAGGGHYEGWEADQIKELYYVLYGEEMQE
jgi:hypothetical protein